jgi:hypothetical protein
MVGRKAADIPNVATDVRFRHHFSYFSDSRILCFYENVLMMA